LLNELQSCPAIQESVASPFVMLSVVEAARGHVFGGHDVLLRTQSNHAAKQCRARSFGTARAAHRLRMTSEVLRCDLQNTMTARATEPEFC
jgi:hypothetical protein